MLLSIDSEQVMSTAHGAVVCRCIDVPTRGFFLAVLRRNEVNGGLDDGFFNGSDR